MVSEVGVGARLAAEATADAAKLKGPRTLFKDPTEILHFAPDFGLKLGQTNPKISGTVPTHRRTTISNDSEPISACLEDDRKFIL